MPETKAERYAYWLSWYNKNKTEVIQKVLKWRREHPAAVRRYHAKYTRSRAYKLWREKNRARLARLQRTRISVEYTTWINMKQRCYNKKRSDYPRYGGKGIKVCARWRNSFKHFLSDMGQRPTAKSLDRYPNPDGNYEPRNCRWATTLEQAHNKSHKVRPQQ